MKCKPYLLFLAVILSSFILGAMMLSGCYSYKYYEFDPPKIAIDDGIVKFETLHSYYDSLSNSWRNLIGKERKAADICWDVQLIYDTEASVKKAYSLKADTLLIYLPNANGFDSMIVPISVNRFEDINQGYNYGYAEYGPIKIDETKYPELEVLTSLEVRTFDSKKLIKIIPIHVKARLKTAHESEFMK